MYSAFQIVGRAVGDAQKVKNDVVVLRLAVRGRRQAPQQGQQDARPSADFLDVLFNGRGAQLAEGVKKGDMVLVTGRVSSRQIKVDGGKTRSVPVLLGTVLRRIGGPRQAQGQQGQQNQTDDDNWPF